MMDNPKCNHVADLIGGKWDKVIEQSRRVYSDDGLCPTLHTCGGGNQEIKIMEDNLTVDPIIYDNYNGKVRNDQNTVGTITTTIGNNAPRNGQKVIESYELSDKMKKYINSYNGKYKVKDSNLVLNREVVSAITTREGCSRADTSTFMTSDLGQNINVAGYDLTKYKIRKLTEQECFKLMGVKPSDYKRVRKNQSKSSCYHLAGDSIVTTCLMALFGQMLDIDWKEKVQNTVEDIIK